MSLSLLQIWAGLPAGSFVTNMFAKDLDAGENGTVTFTLVTGELWTLCFLDLWSNLMSWRVSPSCIFLIWFRGGGSWTLWDWQWKWRHPNNGAFHPELWIVLHSENKCQGQRSHTSGGHRSHSCSGTVIKKELQKRFLGILFVVEHGDHTDTLRSLPFFMLSKSTHYDLWSLYIFIYKHSGFCL